MAFPVEEKFVEIAEAELDARFPESFRNKMMKLNGGCVQLPSDDEVDEDEVGYYELNPFYDTSDKKSMKRTCNSIVHETKTYRDDYGLPQNLIVLADEDGDLLVYKIDETGEIDPKVYWRDRDTEDLIIVANDFSELKEDV
ncbi:SMI1/KNR4 family protein [Microbulbifer hainanensis]|uniref:SMI1/KNR4 family protein n=1 Tax=Microbulbifer hainanensis TaxID=2735675 RepID=UPI00186721E0|nr:SMI1/KNR4 family protein [Microbulbifer hainanensis]